VAGPLALAVVLALAALTFSMRGAGPFLRSIPPGISARTAGLAPALLAALVAIELTNARGILHLDLKVVAVIVAAGLAALRAPLLACVIAGALVAAVLRAWFHL
jgi:uncharacterized membrane protein